MPNCNIIFADTYLYMPLSLSALGDAMELPEQKGYFPFAILTPEFEAVGKFPFPPKEAYPLERMTTAKRSDFDSWYVAEKEKCRNVFDFAEQLEYYCEVGERERILTKY